MSLYIMYVVERWMHETLLSTKHIEVEDKITRQLLTACNGVCFFNSWKVLEYP